jgi:hypothetical protein
MPVDTAKFCKNLSKIACQAQEWRNHHKLKEIDVAD